MVGRKIDHQTPAGALALAAREQFAWPGGYAIWLCTTDGAAICPLCARNEYPSLYQSTISRAGDGWQVAAFWLDVDGEEVTCDHCGASTGRDE